MFAIRPAVSADLVLAIGVVADAAVADTNCLGDAAAAANSINNSSAVGGTNVAGLTNCNPPPSLSPALLMRAVAADRTILAAAAASRFAFMLSVTASCACSIGWRSISVA